MRKFQVLCVFTVLALLLAGSGCSKNKNAPKDVISLKDAKARGPVRPSPEMRAKMKAALNKQAAQRRAARGR